MFKDLVNFIKFPLLVLKEFKIDQEDEKIIKIKARREGLSAWLLNKLSLESDYLFEVTKNHVVYAKHDYRGEVDIFIPINKISSTTCGFQRPLFFIITGILFIFLGLLGLTFYSAANILIIVGIVFIIMYFLNKNVYFSVETSGASDITIRFKRSLIEGVGVDIEAARKAIAILNRLISP